MYSHTHKNRNNKSSFQAPSKSKPFDPQSFAIQQKPENTTQPVTKKELYSTTNTATANLNKRSHIITTYSKKNLLLEQ